MSTESVPAWTVLSVGNPARGDEGFGPAVLNRLARRPELREFASFEARNHTILGILEVWKGRANVVTIGTARGGPERHGHIYRFEYKQGQATHPDGGLREAILLGSGALGLALELGAALGVAPRRLIVYAVHGRDFNLGARLSPPAGAAVAPLVACIRRDILATDRMQEIDDADISETEPYDTYSAWLHHHEVFRRACALLEPAHADTMPSDGSQSRRRVRGEPQ
jgi:hydrogenase maturation protease